MIDAEMRRFIKAEIASALHLITSGNTAGTTSSTEDIANLFPGMPVIPGRPIMQPYGISSRAPVGTLQVTAQQGDHPGNKIVLGHRDGNKPSVNEGEIQLYNEFGQAVYLQNGAVRIGSASAANPAVLGDEIKSMLGDLITLLSTHTHPYMNVATPAVTSAPVEAAQFTTIKTNNLDNNNILSNEVFLEKG